MEKEPLGYWTERFRRRYQASSAPDIHEAVTYSRWSPTVIFRILIPMLFAIAADWAIYKFRK